MMSRPIAQASAALITARWVRTDTADRLPRATIASLNAHICGLVKLPIGGFPTTSLKRRRMIRYFASVARDGRVSVSQSRAMSPKVGAPTAEARPAP